MNLFLPSDEGRETRTLWCPLERMTVQLFLRDSRVDISLPSPEDRDPVYERLFFLVFSILDDGPIQETQ
jgi:hypothetical protein